MVCEPGAKKCDGYAAIVTCNGEPGGSTGGCSPNESCKNAKCILKL
jgi:hypothetical protein